MIVTHHARQKLQRHAISASPPTSAEMSLSRLHRRNKTLALDILTRQGL